MKAVSVRWDSQDWRYMFLPRLLVLAFILTAICALLAGINDPIY